MYVRTRNHAKEVAGTTDSDNLGLSKYRQNGTFCACVCFVLCLNSLCVLLLEELRKVFEWLHFEVVEEKDLSGSGMKELVQKYANMNHSAYDAVVVCVLSHGLEGIVMGVDGGHVSIKDLYKPFTRCPTLIGKPKLFFIQACQGSFLQTGLLLEDGPNDQLDELLQEDAHNPLIKKPSVASEADVLIGMATVEEFKSFRHTLTGSIYIQALCRALESGCPRLDLHVFPSEFHL